MNKRYIFFIILYLIGNFGNIIYAEEILDSQVDYALIKEIQEKTYPGGTHILLVVDRPFDFVPYELINPSRIIIDPVTAVFCNLPKERILERGIISRIKIIEARYQRPKVLDETYYAVDFILLELRQISSYKIYQKDNLIALEFGIAEEEIITAMKEWIEILKRREWTFWSPFKKAQLTTTITQDIEYDDNFYDKLYSTSRVHPEHEEKLITRLYPEFWYGLPLSRDLTRLRLNIYYKPTLTYYNKPLHFFGHYSDLNHHVNSSLFYNPSAKSSLTLNNIYENVERIDLKDQNIIAVFDDHWRDIASCDFRYNFNKNSIRLFYRFNIIQYPSVLETWDELSQEISPTLERKLSGITSVYLTGELKEHSRKRYHDFISKKGTFGIRHKLTKNIDTDTRVSFITTDFFQDSVSRKDAEGLDLFGTVTSPLTKQDTLYLTYNFFKGGYEDPFLRYYTNYFRYNIWLSLYHRFPFEKATSASVTSNVTYEDFPLETRNKKTVEFNINLSRAITKWLQAELLYFYFLRMGTASEKYLNNRVIFRLKYIF